VQAAIEEALKTQAQRLARKLTGALESLLEGASDEEREALNLLIGVLREAEDMPPQDLVDWAIRAAARHGAPRDMARLALGLRKALSRTERGDGSGAVRLALEQALAAVERSLRYGEGQAVHFLISWLGKTLLQGGRPRARRLALRLGWAGRLQLKLEVSHA